METAYAQALSTMIEGGMPPKKAVTAMHELLLARGRQVLWPRIAIAFKRIAARAIARTSLVLSIAHERDERRARVGAKKALAEVQVEAANIEVKVDPTLIGGWRLEGAGLLLDASFKKHLLSLYNAATKE